MKNSMLILGLVATAAGLVGCGGNKVDSLIDKQEAIAKSACECEALTMQPKNVCLAEVEADLPTEAQLDCARAVYDRNTSAIDGPADCVINAANDMQSCIDSAACNLAALQTCQNTFTAATDRCAEIPAAVDAEFSACFS